ncbi:ABC transporter substrate-binding protein [Paenibacillus turpanensis]|uniref:ABC transporter substrate-binding protein n=1 Tax=Paenibacillus turpanensis TaxID=2689078 RepID=UPI001407F971|nr:ABC transporter substrate-binding protein [Paenibacillus turpanensis]
MKRKQIILSVLLMFCVALIASACGAKEVQKPADNNAAQPSAQEPAKQEPAAKPTKLDEIKKAGKIVLGTSADYPPYEFHKTVNGKDEIVGFDIELAKEFAKDLGVKLEIKDMKFDGLLPALQAGNIDVIIAGMTPDEERKKAVDFSKIYYTAVQTVVVRAEDNDKLKTTDDLKGKKVGAQKGSVQEDIVAEQISGSTAKILPKIPDLFMELKSKKVDALVVEEPVAAAYVSKHKDLAISSIPLKQDEGGSAIAFAKNNPELVEAANKTIDRLLKDKLIEKFVAEANDMVE